MKIQAIVAGQQGQIQFLGVDTETVTGPEPDNVATGFVNIRLVTQAAHRLIAHALEFGFHIIGAHAVIQVAQLIRQLAQLFYQRIGTEESIELVFALEFFAAPLDAIDDAVGRILQGLGAALALVQQLLFMGFEGFKNFFALGENVRQKLVVFTKLAFQFL